MKILLTPIKIFYSTKIEINHRFIFFALKSIEDFDIKKFSKKEQNIVNELKSYYKKPSSKKHKELSDALLQYYMDKEEELDDDYDEELEIEDNFLFDDIEHRLRYPMEDVIKLENYSIEKLLSLYNITLESNLDEEDIASWTCEDQLNFSWPYKKEFLKKKLEKEGIMKCNKIVKIVMVSIHDKTKKMYPIFQTKYIIIRNNKDIDYFLRQSMIDIKSRIGQFTKKMDQKEGTQNTQIGPSSFVDLGIEYEKMNVVKIQHVFANGYIELPTRIIHTKSCINIKNDDNKCFLYCHLLHQKYRLNGFKKIQGAERLYGKKAFIYDDKMINVNYEDIEFPIPFNTFYTVKKIEQQNQIRINIFVYKKGKKHDIVPIYHSKRNEYENCMNLLVISDNTQKNIIMFILKV